MRIGVFDSGIGGVAVANELQKAFPHAHILVENDHDNVPYGNKSKGEIFVLANKAVQPLLKADCDVIVIACNTVTAVAIDVFRREYPNQKFIGLEPMVKPVSGLTKSGVIAICATKSTLNSDRYKRSLESYASDLTVLEPDCTEWASLIENNEMSRERIDEVANYCLKMNADVIILGCTHYHWIKGQMIEALGGKAKVIEPTDAIVRRVKELLHL